MRNFALISIAALTAASAASAQETIPQAGNAWFTGAQQALQQKLARQPITGRAKNVILFISDGNGVGSNYALRLFHGQKNGGLGDDNVLPHETMPYLALVKTYNVNAQTPDSAGTGTAMNAGVKTKAGVIGIDETLNRGDCVTDAGKVMSFGSMMKARGKAVGVVSTARITHATPAAVYAHSGDRNWEDNSKIPEGCAQKDIASQLIEKMTAKQIDLAMGGGRRHFLDKSMKGDEGKSGRRTDGANLIETAMKAGVQYAWNDETFKSVKLDGTPILGLFESSHMKYEHDRTGEPSLADMTEAAIKALSTNGEGFYLMVESGRVDHANHAGNAHRMVTDGVAFAEAVQKALEMTNAQETLIIVTADHEHAIAFNGYCGRGSPITGLCYDVNTTGIKHEGKVLTADDGKPYTVIGYLNGPGSVLKQNDQKVFVGERPGLTNEQAVDPDYLQQALIPKSSETHSGEDVAVYARGPWAHLFDGTVEQNYIFHVMKHAVDAK